MILVLKIILVKKFFLYQLYIFQHHLFLVGIISFIILYGRDISISNPALFFTLYALSTILIRPIQGFVYDKCGYKVVIVIASIIAFLSYLMLSYNNSELYYLSGITLGLSMECFVYHTCKLC